MYVGYSFKYFPFEAEEMAQWLSVSCSLRGPEFYSQHPPTQVLGSLPPVTLAAGDLMHLASHKHLHLCTHTAPISSNEKIYILH